MEHVSASQNFNPTTSFHPVDDTAQASEGPPKEVRPGAPPPPSVRALPPGPQWPASSACPGQGGASTRAALHAPRAEEARADRAAAAPAAGEWTEKQEEEARMVTAITAVTGTQEPSSGQQGPRCPEGQRLSWGRGGQL